MPVGFCICVLVVPLVVNVWVMTSEGNVIVGSDVPEVVDDTIVLLNVDKVVCGGIVVRSLEDKVVEEDPDVLAPDV